MTNGASRRIPCVASGVASSSAPATRFNCATMDMEYSRRFRYSLDAERAVKLRTRDGE
jgi:hypothetical protein